MFRQKNCTYSDICDYYSTTSFTCNKKPSTYCGKYRLLETQRGKLKAT